MRFPFCVERLPADERNYWEDIPIVMLKQPVRFWQFFPTVGVMNETAFPGIP